MIGLPVFPVAIALAALAFSCSAAAAEKATLALGGMTITYDPERWDVRDKSEVSDVLLIRRTPASAGFVCTAPECRDRPFAWVAVLPLAEAKAEGRQCPPAIDDDWLHDMRMVETPTTRTDDQDSARPLLIRWVTHSSCRARTPARREACMSSDDHVYFFGTGANFGCGGIEGVPEAMFTELLGGISLTAPGDGPGNAEGETNSPPASP